MCLISLLSCRMVECIVLVRTLGGVVGEMLSILVVLVNVVVRSCCDIRFVLVICRNSVL